jgi:carbamoyltransferase
VEL